MTSRAGDVRHWSPPVVGEQVLLLCPDGQPEQAIAIPALYQDNFPAPSDDPNEHLTIYGDGARIGTTGSWWNYLSGNMLLVGGK